MSLSNITLQVMSENQIGQNLSINDISMGNIEKHLSDIVLHLQTTESLGILKDEKGNLVKSVFEKIQNAKDVYEVGEWVLQMHGFLLILQPGIKYLYAKMPLLMEIIKQYVK